MTFSQSIKTCFSKYATFTGRASRSEYWYWMLFTFLLGIGLGMVAAILGMDEESANAFSGLATLVVLLPGISVLVRRLHDIGKSGWWYWIILIPVAGIIWLIVLLCTHGQPGPNQYGLPVDQDSYNDIKETNTGSY